MDKVFRELRRRNVFRVAGVYAVAGWLLVQVAIALETALSLPAWFDAVITAGLLIGFPIALIFAWAFEMTPEGVKLTANVPEDASITAKTGKKLDYVIVGGLALVVVMIVADRLMPEKAPAPQTAIAGNTAPAAAAVSDSSIAVLPFADLSPQGDQEYFSDGIAEEILNVLVRVQNLEVASRTSSFQFKGREIGVPEIGEQLKVRHVLEGSVRKAGANIRVTAQLIDASNDRHLWSETYDKPLTAENIFAIQDEIANAIVAELGETLGVAAAPKVEVAAATDNVDAYELYLQARPKFESRFDLVEADALLQRAVERDPDFVKAWEMRAAIYAVIDDYGGTGKTPAENRAEALRLCDHVLTLDPNSAMALAVRANVVVTENEQNRKPNDWEALLADYERAIELDPHNPGPLNWIGLRYSDIGYLNAALESFEKCLAIEPFYVACNENRMGTLAALGRDDEAFDIFKSAMKTSAAKTIYAPAAMIARRGEETLFTTILNSQGVLYGYHRIGEIYDAFRTPGRNEALATDIRHFNDTSGTMTDSDLAIYVQAFGAFDMIPFTLYVWDEAYVEYRQSPEFKQYLTNMGIPGYWRAHGFPPQCRPVGPQTPDTGDIECD